MRTRSRFWSACISIGAHGLALVALLGLEPRASLERRPQETGPTVVELIDIAVREDTADAPVRTEGTMKRGGEREPIVEPETRHRRHRRRDEVDEEAVLSGPGTGARRIAGEAARVFVSTGADAPVPTSPLVTGPVTARAAAFAPPFADSNSGASSSAASEFVRSRSPTTSAPPPSPTPITLERGVGGREEDAYAGYGASIVRAVVAEIDRDRIGGIRSSDSIQLVLEILPDGRLASVGPRRFEVAYVEHSTLGWLLQRQVLRRVAHASERFPPHPAGFSKARFVVDVTVRFRDSP